MSFSYNETLPANRDKARALLGDVDSSDVLHSDEHIDAVLTLQGTLAGAVAQLADELVVRFARDPVSISENGVSLNYASRIPVWQALAQTQRVQTVSGGLVAVPATYGAADTVVDEFARPWGWLCRG